MGDGVVKIKQLINVLYILRTRKPFLVASWSVCVQLVSYAVIPGVNGIIVSVLYILYRPWI